jgi:hypothetical protein
LIWLATRVTSWLPRKVSGRKCSTNLAWRPRVHCSSGKLVVLMEDQMAHHSSYWVTESRPEVLT